MLTVFELIDTLLSPNMTPHAGGQKGFSVATSPDYHVTGEPFADFDGAFDSGSVEIYDARTNAHLATIPNPTPASSDRFGSSVAVSGDRVIVGASGDDTRATDAGAAYVFAPLNSPPVALDDDVATDENSPLLIYVLADNGNGADTDAGTNDVLTVSASNTTGTLGAVTVNSDGSFTYEPPAHFYGTDSFGYEISDGDGGTDTATASIFVAAVNDTDVTLDPDSDLVITDSQETTDDNFSASAGSGPDAIRSTGSVTNWLRLIFMVPRSSADATRWAFTSNQG